MAGSDDDKLAALGLSAPKTAPAPSMASRVWDALTTTPKPIQDLADAAANKLNAGAVGKSPFLDKLRGFAAGALQGATRSFANPVGAASAVAGFPEEAVAAPLAKNVIRGAQALSGAAGVTEGTKELLDPNASVLDRAAGGGKAALGALGAVLGIKGLGAAPEEAATAASNLPMQGGVRQYSVPSAMPRVPPEPAPTFPDQWPDLGPDSPRGPLTRAEQVQGIEPLRVMGSGTTPTPNPPPATGPRPPAFTDRSVQAFSDTVRPPAPATSTPEPLELPTTDTEGRGFLPFVNNGSGDSSASIEALNRQLGMKARGEGFSVFDRTGTERPLIGPDAVDYVARPGETFGVRGPNGFQVLDDNGGRVTTRTPAPTLPDRVSEGPAETFDLGGTDEAGESGGAPPSVASGTPTVHPAIQALHESLGPEWQKILDAQKDDGIPFTVDPREELQAFNDRIMNGNPRELMGGERKARLAALAGDETGAISPAAALHLGSTAVGALAGSLDQPDHPVLGAAVGGGIGALAPTLITHPEVAQALRYLNLLSSPVTVGKKVLGDVAGAGKAMLDTAAEGNLSAAGRIGKEFFSPETIRDAYQRVVSGQNTVNPQGTYGPASNGVLGLTHRVYGGITDAAKAAYARAGVPELGDKYTYTGTPESDLAKGFLNFAAKSGPIGEAALPFTRVATNIAEQGVKAIPGVGFLPLLAKVAKGEAVAPSEWAAAGIKQIPGTAAVVAGKEAADKETQEGTPTASSIVSRLGTAAAGPFQVPYEVAKATEKTRLAARKSKEGGTPMPDAVSKALWDTLFPLSPSDIAPSNLLTQAVPSVLPEAARLAGEEPRSFNTHSTLGPTIARIPGLNEVMLRKSATYKPPPTKVGADDAAKLAALGIR